MEQTHDYEAARAQVLRELNAALDAVDADYGGMPIYLERELRVGEAERRRLEALYLVS